MQAGFFGVQEKLNALLSNFYVTPRLAWCLPTGLELVCGRLDGHVQKRRTAWRKRAPANMDIAWIGHPSSYVGDPKAILIESRHNTRRLSVPSVVTGLGPTGSLHHRAG